MAGWSYSGPLKPADVRGCDSCDSVRMSSCLRRHGTPQGGCSTCNAVTIGYCESHGLGAAAALDAYMAGMSEETREGFLPVRAFIDSRLERMPNDAVVDIKFNEFEDDIPDPHGASSVHVERRRGKAHWNMAI